MAAIDEFISRINYFNIDKGKREIYNKLKKSVIFRGMGNPELFLLSLVLGLKLGKRKKIVNSGNLFRINELGNRVWIALSIGFAELNDTSVFETKDGARMAFKVCEEYANAGIDILNDLMKKPTEFIITLTEEIIDK
ncbi:hypothetical protein KAT80_02740 [Candidatus Pacearchaeota archaeon]|nr:hypothetical protein [Candidatus Pacearchaeota archaeon]